jgi:hypothetical protein
MIDDKTLFVRLLVISVFVFLLPLVIYHRRLCTRPRDIRDVLLQEQASAQIRTQVQFRTGISR